MLSPLSYPINYICNYMIVERIQEVLSHFNISPSAFADTLGIPRSSISHLLSGRNKPSLDFVLKLVHKFPEVNLYWLLYGKGDFPAAKNNLVETSTNIQSIAQSIKAIDDTSLADGDENISKIVVFYQDGTFETFRPKK